jgi:hypothetical protein
MSILKENIIDLVRRGTYQLFRDVDNRIIVVTGGGCPCCHPNAGPIQYWIINDKFEFLGHADIQIERKENLYIDENGNIVDFANYLKEFKL